MRSRRWWIIGAALVAALAGSAFALLGGDGEDPPSYGSLRAATAEGGAPAPADVSVRRFARPFGVQTTVPDTLGYPERAATYALEDGGFRVRLMEREVAAVAEDGVVVQQLPRGGVTRRVGWTITIVVGRRS